MPGRVLRLVTHPLLCRWMCRIGKDMMPGRVLRPRWLSIHSFSTFTIGKDMMPGRVLRLTEADSRGNCYELDWKGYDARKGITPIVEREIGLAFVLELERI